MIKLKTNGKAVSNTDLMEELSDAGRELSTVTVLMHTLFARKFGLNATDWKCGDLLDRHGQLTAGELAVRTGLTTGAVTTIIDRLEKAGMARRMRDPDDRRKVVVTTVPGRKEEVMAAFSPFFEAWETVLGEYSESELKTVLKFQRRVVQAMTDVIDKLHMTDEEE